MKKCIKCGQEIADDSAVCEHCGAPQEQETQQKKENLYTDEQVNRILADNKRSLREENKLLKEKLELMESTMGEKLSKVDDLYNAIIEDVDEEEFFEEFDDGEEDDEEIEEVQTKTKNPKVKKKKDMEEAIKAVRKGYELKYEKRLADQGKEISDLRQKVEDAENEVFQTKKSKALDEALVAAGVKSHMREYAAQLVNKEVNWDEFDKKWLFKTPSGADIDLKDGIINKLPEDFMASYTPGAGSGGKGAVSKEVDAYNTAKKRFEAAEKRFKEDPHNETAGVEYMKYRKEFDEFKKKAKASGATIE